jgi:hypothetical protein
MCVILVDLEHRKRRIERHLSTFARRGVPCAPLLIKHEGNEPAPAGRKRNAVPVSHAIGDPGAIEQHRLAAIADRHLSFQEPGQCCLVPEHAQAGDLHLPNALRIAAVSLEAILSDSKAIYGFLETICTFRVSERP